MHDAGMSVVLDQSKQPAVRHACLRMQMLALLQAWLLMLCTPCIYMLLCTNNCRPVTRDAC
jgi:hypothetical protein